MSTSDVTAMVRLVDSGSTRVSAGALQLCWVCSLLYRHITSNSVKNVRHPSSPNAVYRSLAWVAHTCPKVLSRGLRKPDIIAGKKQIKIYFSSSEYGNHLTGPVFAARVLVASSRPFTSTLWLLFFSIHTATPSLEDYE